MTGTDDLRSEHRGVSRMLDIMDGMAASIRRGEQPSSKDLSETVEFLQVFVDKCHHAKEEQLLFPEIGAANVAIAEDSIRGLLADHARGRDAVSRIASFVSRGDADESVNVELAGSMTDYTQLLRGHIVREENECFEPADQGLDQAAQQGLIDGYERIEVEVVGEGVHEGFHALLDRLALTYLE